MMELALIPALVMLAALAVYILLAGADFGAGIWDLLISRRRGADVEPQRRLLAEAIGPVWEANHVWLIFIIVILFTCYPAAFAVLSVALFWPLHLVLIGIVVRGATFVFRAYGSTSPRERRFWGGLFGGASAATPVLLGACLGALSTGRIRLIAGEPVPDSSLAWLRPFPLAVGVLAAAVCAYLAAVYLAWESEGSMRRLFVRRALLTWLAAGAASLGTLWIARWDAPRLWHGLTAGMGGALVLAGILLAPGSAAALLAGRAGLARVLGAMQVAVLVLGWGVAQWPYAVWPDLGLRDAAAPEPTLRAVLAILPLGLAALVPSLWLLFAVFKGRNPRGTGERPAGS